LPSHSVHRLLAQKYLGLSPGFVSEIDRLIDLGPVHDIGRMVPRRPPAYLDVIEQGVEEKLRVLKRHKRVRETLKTLLRDVDSARAFFFHHGLDILGYRVASAIALGLDLGKVCGDLVEGTMFDLELVAAKSDGKHVFEKVVDDLRRALLGSCRDRVLVEWVRATLIPEYEKYKSLDFLRERLLNSLGSILKADARYNVGILLGIMAFTSKYSEKGVSMEILLGGGTRIQWPGAGKIRVSRKDIENMYRKELRERAESLKLSPYGIGRIRKLVATLAALYSDLYHLAYVKPLPLEITMEELLSTRKKKYSLMHYVLDCFKMYSGDKEAIKNCIMTHTVIDNEFEAFTPRYMKRGKINEIKEKLFEALDYLFSLLKTIGIDVLEN
jgi:hypothetical protein